MAERNPNAFAWLGDIIYADAPFILTWRIPASAEKVQRFFNLQTARPEYADFAAKHPIVGVWDDHDTGCNDADLRFFKKPDIAGAVPTALLNFLDEPARSARRARAHTGLHASYLFGTAPRRVHLILLDNRSQRDPYRDVGAAGARNRTSSTAPTDAAGAAAASLARDAPSTDAAGTSTRSLVGGPAAQDMLGPEQWAWLEERLRSVAAEITIIGTGLQVLSRGDPIIAESWSRLPQSQARLMALLAATGTRGVFLLSGDVHFTEANRLWLQYQDPNAGAAAITAGTAAAASAPADAASPAASSSSSTSTLPPPTVLAWPLYDFTSSGMTHSWGGPIKTTVVRTALMHTNRLRGDGLTNGEAAECEAALRAEEESATAGSSASAAGSAAFEQQRVNAPPYCARALADRKRLRTAPGPFGDLFDSELNFAEIDIDWKTTTTMTTQRTESAKTQSPATTPTADVQDADDTDVDAETLLARQLRRKATAAATAAAEGSEPTASKVEQLDADATIASEVEQLDADATIASEVEQLDADATTLTVRGIGAETGRVLWELSFPLSHLYPQPLAAAGSGSASLLSPEAAAAEAARAAAVETAATDARALAEAEAGPLHRALARAATIAGQLARPLTDLLLRRRFLANGIALPTALLKLQSAPSGAAAASGSHDAAAATYDVPPAPAHAVAACASARLDAGFSRDCALFMSGVRPLLGPADSLRYYAGHAAIFTAVLGGLGGICCSPLFLWLMRAQLPFMRLRWWLAAYAVGLAAAAHYIYSLG